MTHIEAAQITHDKRADYVWHVTVSPPGYTYLVTLTEAYYQALTEGRVSPADLIKKSFEFLMEREGPESILREFDLPLINTYFPDYEVTIRSRL